VACLPAIFLVCGASVCLLGSAAGGQADSPPKEAGASPASNPEPCLPIAQRELPPLLKQFHAATEQTVRTQDLTHFDGFVVPGSPMRKMLGWFLSKNGFGGSAGGEIVSFGLPIIMAEELVLMHPARCRWKPETTHLEIELAPKGGAAADGPLKESPVMVLQQEDGRYMIYGVNRVLFEQVNKRFSRQFH
jgi:hypothetical protein